jgi:DNA-binding CsgD family transcriptional regulator
MDSRLGLVGRDGDLRRLSESVLGGHSVLLVGPPGVGKTRLARAALEHIAAQGFPVRTVFGTGATRHVPLGAVSPLLAPDQQPPRAPAGLPANGFRLAQVRDEILAALPRQATTTLLVDDAQLLDGLSAVVIRQLVETARVVVVLVARESESLPHALLSLDLTARHQVPPLEVGEVTTLAETVIGGQLDHESAQRLWTLSGGIPLLVKEILRVAASSGVLASRRDVWRLQGPLPAQVGLESLVGIRLDALGQTAREALEAVALSEPLDVELLAELAETTLLEDLEERGLLRIDDRQGRRYAVLGHPLFAEVLRSNLPRVRRHRLAVQLSRLYDKQGSEPAGRIDPVRATTAVRRALLRIDAGIATDPAELVEAGTVALRYDWNLARVLLEAAVDNGAGPPAVLLLAEMIALADADRSRTLLSGLDGATLSEAERYGAVALRAFVTTFDAASPDDALATLGDVATAPPPLQVAAALAHLMAGRTTVAVELSRPLLLSSEQPGTLRWRAALVCVAAMATSGRLDEAVRLGGLAAAEVASSDETVFDSWSVAAAVVLAHERRGDLARAEQLADATLADLVTRGDERGRPRMVQGLARVALARGRPTLAARRFREVVADLDGADEAFMPWNLALLAVAEAMSGRLDVAFEHLGEVDRAAFDLGVYRPEQLLCRAQVLACAADLEQARRVARKAADLAESAGQAPVATAAWHAVACWGDPRVALPGLTAVAACVDGPLAGHLRTHVEAWVDGDLAGVVEVGDAIAGLGFRPYAAEVFASAVSLAGQRTDPRTRTRATERLRALLDEGEPLTLPAAVVGRAPDSLTRREREIAAMAARGDSDRDIARSLDLSVRTVQAHLAHVYAKTHASGRRDLAALLGRPPLPG